MEKPTISQRKYCRDYGAAEQIYWMLFYARKGKGQAARDALKRFFFPGIDLVTDRYDPNASVDVETQAILRLDHQVTQDMKDSKEPSRFQPLCIGQADIMADDILRLLAYESYIPRSVLVDYLKTLMAFHLALYHLKLLQILPKLVKQRSGNDLCTTKECPINPGLDNALEGCPYRVALVVDMGDVNNPHMAELARKSADRLYRQIPAFVQANFVVKKLDEMAEYLGKKTGKLATPRGGAVHRWRPGIPAEARALHRAPSLLRISSGQADRGINLRERGRRSGDPGSHWHGPGRVRILHRNPDGLSRQVSPPVHHGVSGFPVTEKQRDWPASTIPDQGKPSSVRVGKQTA